MFYFLINEKLMGIKAEKFHQAYQDLKVLIRSTGSCPTIEIDQNHSVISPPTFLHNKLMDQTCVVQRCAVLIATLLLTQHTDHFLHFGDVAGQALKMWLVVLRSELMRQS